jgi:hypothetical protein
MKRTAFRRKSLPKHEPVVEREPRPMAKLERSVSYAGTTGPAVPKDVPLRHEGYRRLVAKLPCKHCGIYGYSQTAHANTGKGAGTKASDLETFPLCTIHPAYPGGPLVQGCHEKFDQGALFTKAVRREIEPVWAADTRRTIQAMGLWPKRLPMLEEA